MITIIVLLILAGVSISLVMGDSGVFTQAKDASIKTTEADIEEALGRAVASAQGVYTTSSEFSSGRKTFYDWLKSNSNKIEENGYTIEFNQEEWTDEEDIIGTIQKEGKSNKLRFKISEGEGRLNINVDVKSGPPRGQSASELEEPTSVYGKFVKYGVELSGDTDDTNDWKIFYIDEKTNRIFLIAADYVPNLLTKVNAHRGCAVS